MTIQKQFIDETAKPAAQIDIELCALLFAAQIRPELMVDDWTRVLDDQVNAFLAEYEVADGDPLANSELLIEVVGNALGYRGDSLEYFSADNSLFDRVIENRLGIPISLAAIYMSVGQRLGIKVHGVGYPGHFLVRIVEQDGTASLVDPFSHKLLSAEDIRKMKSVAKEQFGGFDEAWLSNAHPHDMLVRMLENLKRVFFGEGNLTAAQHCVEYQLILKPEKTDLLAQLQAMIDHAATHRPDVEGSGTVH